MSEQDPLFPSQSSSQDPEANIGPDEDEKERSWRENTAESLESTPFHYAVITLVLIDSVCVLADLGYSFLSEGCQTPEGPDAPVWLNVLAHVSLAITTLFLVEIPVTLWAFGPDYYNPFGRTIHASLHLFDALVILTTFVLEVVLKGRERELASLLIVLRLWRLVKLVGGLAVGAGEIEEENAKDLAETRQRLDETTLALTQAREENQQLRARITWLESGAPSEGTN